MLIDILVMVGVIIICCFMFTVFWGAPFVPSHKEVIEEVFKLAQLKKDDKIIDLGSGDGRLLLAAAKREIYAIGYEINPILFFISLVRTRKYRSLIKVRFGSYKLYPWPKDIDAVYIFGINHELKFLSKKVKKQSLKTKIISYSFKLPGYKIQKESKGLFLYEIS